MLYTVMYAAQERVFLVLLLLCVIIPASEAYCLWEAGKLKPFPQNYYCFKLLAVMNDKPSSASNS